MGNSWQTTGRKGSRTKKDDEGKVSSLEKRARKRTVKEVAYRKWAVLGEGKLGDAYGEYAVSLPTGGRKYECSCYSHGQGDVRRRKMCSHVLAVVIHRRENEDVFEAKVVEVEVEAEEDERARGGTARGDGADGVEAEGAKEADEADEADTPVVKERTTRTAAYPDTEPAMDDSIFGTPPMPQKFRGFRDAQWDTAVEVMEHFDEGKKVVMLSAPTGSGKSLVGETVRRLHGDRSVYCCTTKSLQDQIQREFPYALTIKGRANYPTQFRPDLDAGDCTATQSNGYTCNWCEGIESCPYRVAKDSAALAPLPILNTAYFLAETSSKRGSRFLNRDLVIIDEADTIEEQLMGSIEVVIGAGLRKQIGVWSLPKKTVAGDWVRWLEDEIVPGIQRKKNMIRSQSSLYEDEQVKARRQIQRLDRLLNRIRPLLVTSESGKRPIEEGWVMTGYEGNGKDPTIRFKPIRVDEHAREKLWSRGQDFLLMSATLISPSQMAEDLGLDDDEWAVVTMDSTFPIVNRPVFVPAVASMTNKTKETAWPKMAEAVEKVIEENAGRRVLVHTVSYALTKYLMDNMKTGRTLTYYNAQYREEILREFLDRSDAVLLAPSFERGVDLPEEDCEVIVIAKVPYPYLGDKQIAARMYGKGGQAWYAVQTIRAIVQMTGRGMRSKDDWCDTVILDAQFKRLYRENKRLFPKWWRESVVLSLTDPRNRKMVEAAKERREGK